MTSLEATAASIPKPVAQCVRLALVGDVVGKPGMRIAAAAAPWLRSQYHVEGLFVNAENAADGSGLRCKDYRRLIDAGYDAITLGDHVYRKREIMEILGNEANIVRPCNLPASAPGKSHVVVRVGQSIPVAVISALGRVFMKPVDCPFRAVERELELLDPSVRVRLVDFHAEATSDKQVMARYLDGRVSAVLGTHTHVATADEQILPRGTGFQCDVGMTGPLESILGRKIDAVIEATLDSVPISFQVATGNVRLNASWCDVDLATGQCRAIGRISVPEATIVAYHEALAKQRTVL